VFGGSLVLQIFLTFLLRFRIYQNLGFYCRPFTIQFMLRYPIHNEEKMNIF
jgi:hypothetical protein